MNIEELRIGSIVKIHGKELRFTKYDFNFDEKFIEPIEITEKWLFAFGFKNIDTNENGGDNYYYLSKSDFQLDRNFQHLDTKMGFELKYLHQLQNLHLALTGDTNYL